MEIRELTKYLDSQIGKVYQKTTEYGGLWLLTKINYKSGVAIFSELNTKCVECISRSVPLYGAEIETFKEMCILEEV